MHIISNKRNILARILGRIVKILYSSLMEIKQKIKYV